MLSDAGFHLNVVTVDYLKDYNNNGQGIFFKGAPPNTIVLAYENTFSDPDDYLFNTLSPQGARNHEFVNDPALTQLIQQEQRELDDNKRLQLVYQIQQMQDAAMYYPPTVNGAGFTMVQPWVQNYLIDDGYGYGTETLAYLSVTNR